MDKKDETRKSECFVNYDAQGKKFYRVYGFGRKVETNAQSNKEDILRKLEESHLEKSFPAYPFRSGLSKADGFLFYSPAHRASREKATGGFQMPLTKRELTIIDKAVGSREVKDIKCFLTQKCSVQDPTPLAWNEVIDHLNYWLKQPANSGKAGDKWYWKLYERTIKAFFSAILDKANPS